MRWSLLTAVFLLIVVLAFLTLQYVGVTSIVFNMDFQIIRQGLWGRKGGGYYVIQNAEDWAEICMVVSPPDTVPPEINFSTQGLLQFLWVNNLPQLCYKG